MVRIFVILGTLLVSLFLLVPSFFREDSKLLKIFPAKRLNLGLDLRGGIHVVLGVEFEKAFDVELDRMATDYKTRLEGKKIFVDSMERVPGERAFRIRFHSEQDAAQGQNVLKNDFYQMLTLENWSGKTTADLKLDPSHEKNLAQMSVEQAREVIRNRVDEFGVAEPVIQVQGEDRIVIQLPGVEDPERAIQLIGRTALLEFKLVDESLNDGRLEVLVNRARDQIQFKNNFTRADLERLNQVLKKDLPPATEVSFEKDTDRRSKESVLTPLLLKSPTLLTGQALEDARVGAEAVSSRPQVSLRFSKSGAEVFEKLTEANVGKRLAILLDGVVVSAPSIQERIPAISASAAISFNRPGSRQEILQEAKDLALVLRSGALPAPVEILENRTIGASLGEDSIRHGTMSGLMAALLVILFMVIYYRWSGLLADFTMTLNILMILAIMSLFQATLTLPGIAGIVLTIGMAVDANVLIFERIREEIKAGKRARTALEAGYHNAHSAILDSNLTSIIAGVVLYNFGSGPIRGFAVTLLIGLVCNYITAVWFARWLHEWFANRLRVERISI